MQLRVLSPDQSPRDLPLVPVQIDTSDSTALTWIDLDRTETPDLPGLLTGISVPLARDLLDPSPTAHLRDRGDFRWLSLLGVRETSNGPDLADLDIVVGPGVVVTIHSDDRPALRRLGDPTGWRHPLTPPLSGATLVRILEATLDAYDDLVDRAEEEVQRLQAASPTGNARAGLVRDRQRLEAIRRRLASQRSLFGEVAGLRIGPGGDGSPWLLDRLESAIGAAQSAADYAAAASWALARDSRQRTQQLAWVLIGSWVTVVVVAVSVRLSGATGAGEVDPILFVGAMLGIVTVVVLAAVWSRRWN